MRGCLTADELTDAVVYTGLFLSSETGDIITLTYLGPLKSYSYDTLFASIIYPFPVARYP